jgi:2-phosphoglycerate kinase
MPILFAIAGATGIGKSRLSLDLAERFDAEIIGFNDCLSGCECDREFAVFLKIVGCLML